MLHVLMRFPSLLHLLSQSHFFVPSHAVTLLLTHSCNHIYSDFISISLPRPSIFSALFLSLRYWLSVSEDRGLCMIEIAVANGTANRSQKYVSEPSSEVNPILSLV